jgi:hypothetical protein
MSFALVSGLYACAPDRVSREEHPDRYVQEASVRLLLTSGGVTNPSIGSALVELLGKPVAESHALCVPTAQWGHPMCGPASVRGLVAAEPTWQHFSGLAWASLGVPSRHTGSTCPRR